MFKRPAYISILVGFLSIYSVIMILVCLRLAFLADVDDTPPIASATVAPNEASADAPPPEGPKPIPVKAMPFIALAFAVLSFICTVNMLEGANWARWLYTISFLLILIVDILDFSDHIFPYLPSLIIRGIVVPFLFLPGANEFFRRQD